MPFGSQKKPHRKPSFLPGIDSLVEDIAGFYKPKARLSSMRYLRGTSRSDGLGISPILFLTHL
jgi:hypothetical protein